MSIPPRISALKGLKAPTSFAPLKALAPFALLTAFALLVTACQIGAENLKISVASLDTNQIVNIHESVEDDGDIAKLLAAMDDLGIDRTVLHGVPYDLLHYTDQNPISYENLDENHAFIQEMSDQYPDRFSFFCAVDPADLNRLGEVEECLDRGGLGIKLYTGYSYAHDRPLDDPKLLKVYAQLDETGGILMLPVNTQLYQDELERVLTAFPDLPVICPHYCLSSSNLENLGDLLDEHPNLYTDTSFGHVEFVAEGFKRMSDDHEEFQAFFEKYQDRILFGTDTVVTGYEYKNRDWIGSLSYDYLSILTGELFESRAMPLTQYLGLDLSPTIQRKIFWENWNRLTESL